MSRSPRCVGGGTRGQLAGWLAWRLACVPCTPCIPTQAMPLDCPPCPCVPCASPLAQDCHMELNADYDGPSLTWGLTYKKASAAQCCQACKEVRGLGGKIVVEAVRREGRHCHQHCMLPFSML